MESKRLNLKPTTSKAPSDGDLICEQLKASGQFDQLRKHCLEVADTKPSYYNQKIKVEEYVARYLSKKSWSPQQCKSTMRESLRKSLESESFMHSGIQHIVDQVVNHQRISNEIYPLIEKAVCQHLGMDAPPANYRGKQQNEALRPAYYQEQGPSAWGNRFNNSAQHSSAFAHGQHTFNTGRRYNSYYRSGNSYGHARNNDRDRHYNDRGSRPFYDSSSKRSNYSSGLRTEHSSRTFVPRRPYYDLPTNRNGHSSTRESAPTPASVYSTDVTTSRETLDTEMDMEIENQDDTQDVIEEPVADIGVIKQEADAEDV